MYIFFYKFDDKDVLVFDINGWYLMLLGVYNVSLFVWGDGILIYLKLKIYYI